MKQKEHIDAFNHTIIILIKTLPDNPLFDALEEYKDTKPEQDYYLALDRLGFEMGISYHVETKLRGDNFIYSPLIKIRPNNIMGLEEESRHYGAGIRSLKSAYTTIAKEYLYFLMQHESSVIGHIYN